MFIISHAVSLGFELRFATYFSIWRGVATRWGRGYECTFHSVSQIHSFFYFLSSIISKNVMMTFLGYYWAQCHEISRAVTYRYKFQYQHRHLLTALVSVCVWPHLQEGMCC